MAVYKTAELAGGLNSKVRLPRNRYTVRCIDEKFGNSKSSGNPMITREWELCLPESIEINGKSTVISGAKMLQYLTVKVLDKGERDKDASEKVLSRLAEENRKLGLPSEEIDDDAPLTESCVGKVADAIVSSEEYVARLDLTPEQKAKGDKLGSPIKDELGKDVISYKVKLESILGLSSADVCPF